MALARPALCALPTGALWSTMCKAWSATPTTPDGVHAMLASYTRLESPLRGLARALAALAASSGAGVAIDFWGAVLPCIQALARRLHDVLPDGIPLLGAQAAGVVALSRAQCASALAAMFLCALETQGGGDFPWPSFLPLLTSDEPQEAAKLAMHINYFARVAAAGAPVGTVHFRRAVVDAGMRRAPLTESDPLLR